MEKYCRAGQATDENMVHAHCMLDTKAVDKDSEYVIVIAFPLQQWLYESASLLRDTNIGCLVDKDAISFAMRKVSVQFTYL